MNKSIVKIENLSHRYATSWAIKDINIEINDIGIVGLLGSNGAGKSTTMNILCGVLSQTSGNVYIDGIDIREQPEEAKKKIGFLPQTAPLYTDLTVNEYLRYSAELRLIPSDKVDDAVEEAKDRCGISHFGNRLIGNLSGGYRQRVGIAQCIIHKPKVVILDEPTNGLDPNQITEVRELIKDIAKDRLVIFSSHILTEVQVLCKDIKMIEGGKIVFSDSMEAFNNYVEPHSVVMVLENPPAESDILNIEGVEKVSFLTERKIRVHFNGNQELTEQLVKISVEKGWRLREMVIDKSALDEVFKQLSNKKNNL